MKKKILKIVRGVFFGISFIINCYSIFLKGKLRYHKNKVN